MLYRSQHASSSALADSKSAQVKVVVELWDLILRQPDHMTGYLTFRCTVEGPNSKGVGFMGTRVRATTKNEWTFPISSNGAVINMAPANDKDLQKYVRNALKDGEYYVKSGQIVNTPHPRPVKELVDAMQVICVDRASNGDANSGLREKTMSALGLNARKRSRERGEYGDMSLAGIEWAFAESWRRTG